jgi:membrane-associated phospholipid phosphatase
MKTWTGRTRPDNSDTRSFPSGHTSAVAVNASLTNRNIEYLAFNPFYEGALKAGMHTLTLATGWARIEGDKHYPTDVLMATALGNFVGNFINDSFLGRFSYDINLTSRINPDNVYLSLRIRF